MAIQYNGNLINVSSDNKDKNLLVYSHPGDNIKFDFDISSLVKKIINGDLVIYLLNGRTITLVNFGLMALDNKAPNVSDLSQSYTPFSLFDSSYYYEDNGVAPYVISRQISSPDSNILPTGKELPSSKDIFLGEYTIFKYSGLVNENADSNNNEVSPYIQDYITKTLFSSFTKLENSTVNYISNNRFKYDDQYNDIYPIKLLLVNPKVIPEYGCGYDLIKSKTHLDYEDLIIPIGGGKLPGNENAHFMYEPETIDLTSKTNKVWFDGPSQSDNIIRWFAVQLPNPSILVDKVIISGLPSGVIVPKGLDNNLEVKQFGGTVEITVKGNTGGGVEIPIQYALGFAGENGINAAVSVSYYGTQSKTGDLVKGNVASFFEFKPVRSGDDISNFDKFNTFTFSTLRDPLIIRFTPNDDVIKGGRGDYTYYGNAGDNKAYGGEANEIFHLGVGNNSFYANALGNATVDVDNVNKKNALYLSDAIDKADSNTVYTTINNGKIYFGGTNPNGKTFTTTATDFTYLYFNIGDGNVETERNNTLTISSTKNLRADINVYLGKTKGGNHIVKGDDSPMVIQVKPNFSGENTLFINTKDINSGVFINWGEDSSCYILGSFKNDTIIGSNSTVPIKFDGTNRGENTADYSNITLGLTYNAATGIVNKEGLQASDHIIGIKNFIGGANVNIFYGATHYTALDGTIHNADINYFCITSSIEEQNILSYEKLAEKDGNGVIINLINSEIKKLGTGGVDKFSYIGNIKSSNNDDTFIISNDPKSRTLDGLKGFNTIDYSNLGAYTRFTIEDIEKPSNVQKGEGGNYGIDTIINFRHFIGSNVGSEFIIKDTVRGEYNVFGSDDKKNFRFILEAKSNEISNRVSYSDINGKAIILDLSPQNLTATLYKGAKLDSGILAKDKLININSFFLSKNAENKIFAYDDKVLVNYTIDGGAGGNNTLTFEKSSSNININFGAGAFNNIANIDNLLLSNNNDTIVMGYYCFAKVIDGLGGINKVDFSYISGPLYLNIDLTNIDFDVEINDGKKVAFKNFQQTVSTYADDYYTIKFDLQKINEIKDKHIFFDGSLGLNTIDFQLVNDSANNKNGLIIDLSGEICTVKDIKGNNVLDFINFTNIIGSEGNDTFILPKGSSIYQIDGGKGDENAVSYQAYTNSIYINKDIFSKFKNIQKIIGSQGDDTVELDKDSAFNVDGYNGFNTLIYSKDSSFESLTVTISASGTDNNQGKSLITVDKGNGKIDKLSTIGYINLENNIVTNGAEFFINNQDNYTLNKDGKVFLSGSKVESGQEALSKITYEENLKDITLNLQVESSQRVTGSWINVTKGNNNNIDYIQNFKTITLSKKSTVNVFDNISSLQNVKELIINGKENSTLSFEFYSIGLKLNVQLLELEFQNNIKIKFDKGFTNFKASRTIDTQYTFFSFDDKNYTFNGLESETTLSYENIDKDISIVISKENNVADNIYNSISIKKGDTTDKAYNVINFVGSKGVTNILVNYSFNRNMSFTGNEGKKNENSINYQGLSVEEALTFDISESQVLAGRLGGEYYDIIKNINKIIGSNGNTRFRVDNNIINTTNTYELDGKGGINTLNLINVDSNLIYNLDDSGKISVGVSDRIFLSVKNIHILFGSGSKENNFKLGNFFEGKYFATGSLQLYGSNTGKDVLDLTESKRGFSLDPLTGKIIDYSGNQQLSLITMTGIPVIKLGDGNHQIDISTKTSNVGWKEVIGGKGQNNVSFDKMISSINYNLAEGVEGLTFKIVNFTGITGTRNSDIFYLNENSIEGIRINGNGGTSNLLDYSKLTDLITVDIANKKVTRGSKTDTVENISVFKSGTAGGKFIAVETNIYQFIGLESQNIKNTLDYSNVKSDLIFSFINGNVLKPNGVYDRFSNITEFIGGSGENNTFMFTINNISQKFNEIIINGGKGKNNIINLTQLGKGITYNISDQFFEVDNNNTKLKVVLININNFIGTSHGDTFIFSDKDNGISINGGNNIEGKDSVIDLSNVTNSVTVDFASKLIIFANNKNYFVNVNTFIGSKKGGDTFKGLNSYTRYNLTGGAGGNNTIIYDNCSAPITLKVENNKLIINKSGSINDTLTNLQNIVLTNLADTLILNNIADLSALANLTKTIDGGQSNNLVLINFKIKDKETLTFDLIQGKIIHEGSNYNINFKNFTDWEVSKEGFNPNANYNFILPKELSGIRYIKFSAPSNYLNNYYTTVDIRNVADNLFLVIDSNKSGEKSTNIDISLTGSKYNNTILLHNVTKIIVPEGKHYIDYGTVVYRGDNNSSFILNLEVANPEKTEINYLLDELRNEVGKTFIYINAIKFAEKGTKSDINFTSNDYSVTINKLVSKKDYVEFCLDQNLTDYKKPFNLYFRELDIKDNTFVLRSINFPVFKATTFVKILNSTSAVFGNDLVPGAINLTFLNSLVNKPKLFIDTKDNEQMFKYDFEFYTYKSVFSDIEVGKTAAKFLYNFSYMDTNAGGGGIYAIFDFWEGDKFYSYTPGGTLSENNKITSLKRVYNRNELIDLGQQIIETSTYEDFFDIVITNRYINGDEQRQSDYAYNIHPSILGNHSYTLRVSFVKRDGGPNPINIEKLAIRTTHGNQYNTYLSFFDETNAAKPYKIGIVMTFYPNNNEAVVQFLTRTDLIIHLDPNIFAKQVIYSIDFWTRLDAKNRSITLPDPQTVAKYEKLTFEIILRDYLVKEKAINSTTTVFTLKNNSTFADSYTVNSDYDLIINNIPLKECKFTLADMKWMDTSNQYTSSVILQGDNNSSFFKFMKFSNPFNFNLMNKVDVKEKYTGVFDISNMYLGNKGDINDQTLTFVMSDLNADVCLSKGGSNVSYGKINFVNSIRIQREDMSFITAVKYTELNSDNFKLNPTTLFSFGEMNRMKLPSNKDYQIFTKTDRFIPGNKRWNGSDPIEKTYTNFVSIDKLTAPNSSFDVISNNRFSISSIHSTNMDGVNSLSIKNMYKETNFSLYGLDPKTPFAIVVENCDSKFNLKVDYSAQPGESVVLRIFRDSIMSGGTQAVTFTNDYDYDNANFKYYGTFAAKFNSIYVSAVNYTVKSFENRDHRFADIPKENDVKIKSIALNYGTYSFSDVDIGDLRYYDPKTYNGSSAVIVFKKGLRDGILTSGPSFFVTDSVMAREAEDKPNGYGLNNNLDVNNWLNALINVVSKKSTVYSGVTKFIITGNRNKIDDNIPDNPVAREIPLRVFLDTNQFDQSYTAIFQRDVYKGGDLKKYLDDYVSFNADTIAELNSSNVRPYDTGVFFNGKDVALSYDNNRFLVKNMAFSTKLQDKIEHDQGMIYGNGCKAWTLIFSSELLIPDHMKKGDNYDIFFDLRNKSTVVSVVLPHVSNEIFNTYKYEVTEPKPEDKEKIWYIKISLKDFSTNEYYSTYKIKIKLNPENEKGGIKFTYTNTLAEHYEYIYNNYKDLYDLTLEGNDTKINLDKVKDTFTGEAYLTWNNQQEYLNSLDKTSATNDYWMLIDKFIEEAFNIKPVEVTNSIKVDSQQDTINKSMASEDNIFLKENDYLIDNTYTNHSSIFTSSLSEDSWEDYWEEYQENKDDKSNNEEFEQLEEYLESNSQEINNHSSVNDSSIVDNVTESTQDNIDSKDSISLSNLFEKVKSISKSIDNTTLVEEFGLSNITLEDLNHTYHQDETNSMSYTIDGCTNIASNCGNDYTIETTAQENQKNKTNH